MKAPALAVPALRLVVTENSDGRAAPETIERDFKCNTT
jgi:hypothetical protein